MLLRLVSWCAAAAAACALSRRGAARADVVYAAAVANLVRRGSAQGSVRCNEYSAHARPISLSKGAEFLSRFLLGKTSETS